SYFVPDYLPCLIWEQRGGGPLFLEPRFDLRYVRGQDPRTEYHTANTADLILLHRTVSLSADAEAEPLGWQKQPNDIRETLWVACALDGSELTMVPERKRWKPMWHGRDAARLRFLRSRREAGIPVLEHAPLSEVTTQWVYAPCRIGTRDGSRVAFGFGQSMHEAVSAARLGLEQAETLKAEKCERLNELCHRTYFSTGHVPTDQAYGHVVSRLADCLVVDSPAGPSPSAGTESSILAGNAYFQESWKRDENIALGGLLASGQHAPARRILDATWRGQDDSTGRLPLRLRPGEEPGYTSSDATLWALLRLSQYLDVTGDEHALDSKLPLIEHFFRRSLDRCGDGYMLPSGGVAVDGHDWETWMDTEFSARRGYPIEIQLLWLVCMRRYAALLEPRNPDLAGRLAAAQQVLTAALQRFRADNLLVDHLSPDGDPVTQFTPNAFFWTILDIELDWDWEAYLLHLGRRELGGVSGIRTLARSQWASVLGPEIAALVKAGRPLPSLGKLNYHRGLEWNWLAQLFVAGELRHGRPDMAFDHYLARQIHDATSAGGLGGVSELFDHRGQAGPSYQSWSMTGLVESLHRFAGVIVDTKAALIAIRPQKPRHWPQLRIRKWIGDVAFDIAFTDAGGLQTLDIAFDGEVPEVDIQVEFVLKPRRRVRSIAVAFDGRQPQSVDWHRSSRPNRAVVRVAPHRNISLWMSS
ncbi:MAG TPA: amylo-alpha-1,6-glucosidase, partial [Chloroflexota bacterium]|nr:amylo-alpha-1,6-glucosidase [Chloroflexota bacterium]